MIHWLEVFGPNTIELSPAPPVPKVAISVFGSKIKSADVVVELEPITTTSVLLRG